jgi:hypothetical protein
MSSVIQPVRQLLRSCQQTRTNQNLISTAMANRIVPLSATNWDSKQRQEAGNERVDPATMNTHHEMKGVSEISFDGLLFRFEGPQPRQLRPRSLQLRFFGLV